MLPKGMARSRRVLLLALLLVGCEMTRVAQAQEKPKTAGADKAASKDDAKKAAKEAEAKAAKEAAAAAAAKKARLEELQQLAGFDYLVLTRIWPPSLCKLTTCNQATYNLFTINGLWPTLANGSQPLPESCADQQAFNKDLLPLELRGRMSCEWRNFQTGNLANFWGYQWRRHGACAAPLFDALLNGNGTLADTAAAQPVYFSTAMRLHERWDINEALVRQGFNPLSATSATAAQVVGLLRKQWNVTTDVTCAGGMLHEVRTCFSLDLEPISCPHAQGVCPRVAQDLPYGNDNIPQLCQSYFDGIPKAENIEDPTAGQSGAPQRTATALAALATLAAAALAAL